MFCLDVKLPTCKWRGNDMHFHPSASLVGKQGSGWASAKVKSFKMALGYHFLFVARETRGSAYASPSAMAA